MKSSLLFLAFVPAFLLGTGVAQAQLTTPVVVTPPVVTPPVTVDIPPVTVPGVDIPSIPVVLPDVNEPITVVPPVTVDTGIIPPVTTPGISLDPGSVLDLPDLPGLPDTGILGNPISTANGILTPVLDQAGNVVGQLDAAGRLLNPQGQVIAQGGTGGSGGQGGNGTGGAGGTGNGGNGRGGNSTVNAGGGRGDGAGVRNNVSVKNTTIALPAAVLGTYSKTTTATEQLPNGFERVTVDSVTYSTPTISGIVGTAGGEFVGMVQVAFPLR